MASIGATHNPAIAEAVDSLKLVDHHVHGALKIPVDGTHFELVDHHVQGELQNSQEGTQFEGLFAEIGRSRRSARSIFDNQAGLAVRRWCAPLLDLDRFAEPSVYLERRAQLGTTEVNRRLLRAAGLHTLLIDTGFAAGDLLDVEQMGELSGASSYEVVRLEAVAEDVARGGTSAAGFADAFRTALQERLSRGAVATKSIAAYRYGLDIPAQRPSAQDVEEAMGQWLAAIEISGVVRVDHPVLLSFLLWSGIDVRLPVQIHTGYGDTDLNLIRSNPACLTDLLRVAEPMGTAVVLLHCYPYQREAAYLAQMFSNVYYDIGEGIYYSGVQSRQLIAESFEVGPFGKQLYSSDGWGLAEFHFLGSRLWRNGLISVFSEWVDEGHWSEADAVRIANMVGRQNALDLYHLDESS